MKSTIYYAVAEADFIFRQSITDSISRSPFYKLVHAAGNGHELINSMRKHPLDIVLIDLFMPVLSGIEAIKLIRMVNSDLPAICYTHTYQADIAAILAPIKNVFYCEKKMDVVLGKMDVFFRSGSIDNKEYERQWAAESAKKIHALVSDNRPTLFNITELRLMKFTYDGLTNKEMAAEMNLSNRTVDTYMNRLTEKLGLRSKTDLIRYAVQNGIYNTSL